MLLLINWRFSFVQMDNLFSCILFIWKWAEKAAKGTRLNADVLLCVEFFIFQAETSKTMAILLFLLEIKTLQTKRKCTMGGCVLIFA